MRGSVPDDLDRPLDALGEAQAEAVAELLGDVGATRLLSSVARRCVATLEPLAERLGIAIETTSALLEGQSPLDTLALVRALAADGTSAVLCSHGDLIPTLIAALESGGATVVEPRGWGKGSVWQLDTDAGRVVRATFLRSAI